MSRTSKSVVRRCFTFLACGDTSDISRRVDSRQANRQAESRDRVACRDDSDGQDKQLVNASTVPPSTSKETSGGYCGGVPPLPIPNREVKPACADGTAMQCGRVGSRLFLLGAPRTTMSSGLFFLLVAGTMHRRTRLSEIRPSQRQDTFSLVAVQSQPYCEATPAILGANYSQIARRNG